MMTLWLIIGLALGATIVNVAVALLILRQSHR